MGTKSCKICYQQDGEGGLVCSLHYQQLLDRFESLRLTLVGSLTAVGEFLPAGLDEHGRPEDPCAPGVIRSRIEHLAADRGRWKREAERLEGLIGEEARLIGERDAMRQALTAARSALEPHTCDGGNGGCGCEGSNDACRVIGDIDEILANENGGSR